MYAILVLNIAFILAAVVLAFAISEPREVKEHIIVTFWGLVLVSLFCWCVGLGIRAMVT